ncbi:MAG: hypothetical protein ABI183_21510 [Polyangiaceae bacterium]
MSNPEESPPSSSDLMAAAARAQKTRTRVVLGLIGAAVVIGGASIAVMTTRGAHAATQKSWSELSSCVLGDPLSPNERASVRARGIQLAVLGVPPEKRVGTNDVGWPGRCATYASAVVEALHSSDDTSPLVQSATKLADALKVGPTNPTLGTALDDAWRDAEKISLNAIAADQVGGVTAPPKPITALTVEKLPLDSRILTEPFSLASLSIEPTPSTTLRFLIDEKDLKSGPTLCEMPPNAKTITCKKIPAPAAQFSPALRLWGTTEDGSTPFVFVGDHGRDGIFRADTGAVVEEKLQNGAYGIDARKDGSYAMLVWKDQSPQTRLEVVSPGAGADGARKETALFDREKAGNPYYNTALFWDYVINKQYVSGHDDDGIRLFVRNIAADGSVGAPLDIGRVGQYSLVEGGDEPPHIRGCRDGDSMVIRVKGANREYFSFLVAGKWTQPVEGDSLGGDLVCRGNQALVTGVESRGEKVGDVYRTRCDATTCKTDTVQWSDLFAHNDDIWPASTTAIHASDVGGKVAVVWQAGQLGGLRIRVAAADLLARAEDVVVFDDRMQDGILKPDSTLLETNMLSHGDTTLLFVRVVLGVFVFKVEASGALTPVKVEQ